MMKFGLHVSAAGGLWNAPKNAANLGCETYQMFSRPPQGGKAQELTEEVVKRFHEANKKYGFADFVIHAPYYINLASAKPRIRHSSIRILREELERGHLLGAKYMMAHLGSAKDVGDKTAMKAVVSGVKKILKGYRGSTQFLMEISAGAGRIIGDTFEELAEILSKVKSKRLGVCFDTQHAFASGYDLRTKAAVQKTIRELDKIIGLNHVPMTHCNDSKVEFGAKKDRHEHIGKGFIGKAGFRELIHHAKLKHWLWILETPWDGDEKKDLEIIKKFRKEKSS